MNYLWFVALAVLIALASMPLIAMFTTWAFDVEGAGSALFNERPAFGPARVKPFEPNGPASAAHEEVRAHASDTAVTFDGRDYRYAGFRYERREDAIAYEALVRARARAASIHGSPA